MNFEEWLQQSAERYRKQGYAVTVRPSPEQLPDFAKDFKVQILATKPDHNALAVMKKYISDLEGDPDLKRYAVITNAQPGWRFDLFVMGPDPIIPPTVPKTEPSSEGIRDSLNEVRELLKAGFIHQSLAAAFAALEAAMRKKLRELGDEAGWGSSPRTMLNELFSEGAFSNTEFRNLEQFLQLRNSIVHGFASPEFNPSIVLYVNGIASRLILDNPPESSTKLPPE